MDTLSVLLALFYMLFVFFAALMNLERAMDDGRLHGSLLVLTVPTLVIGATLDFSFQVLATVFFFDLPQELTLSRRLSRYYEHDGGWRKAVALWFKGILDPLDPHGPHIH